MTLISRKFGFWNFLETNYDSNNNSNTDEQFHDIGIGIINPMITGINQMLIDSTFTSSSSPSSVYELFDSIKIDTNPSSSTINTNNIFAVEKHLVDYFKDFWRKKFDASSPLPLKKLNGSFRQIASYIKIAIISDFNIKGNT
jgi:hypothetical protein